MKKYQDRQWEAHTNLRDGFSRIEFADGEELTVKNDGVTGADFVTEYLEEMQVHYKSHLEACDLKLRARLGKAYKTIRSLPNRYRSELALISLNCCFGKEDVLPDHENDGNFHPEFTFCPERYNCPFNGFAERNRGKRLCGCNPVFECGLTPVQARLATLLIETPLSYEEMAGRLGCSYSNIDNIRRRIFETLGVTTRQELIIKMRGKRLF